MRQVFNLVMNFILNVINLVKQKLTVWMDQSSKNSLPPMPAVELESSTPARNTNTTTDEGQFNSLVLNGTTVDDQMKWQWPLLIFGAFFAAASAALQALQTKGPLPTSSQVVYVVLVFSFTAMIVSVYIRSNYKPASLAAAHVGIFFGGTAVMVALVVNLQTPLMVISIAIYSIGTLVIIFAKIFKSTP